MRAVNVIDDGCYEFWELCRNNGWTTKEYDDFDVLEMFEGDPDMIRINGQLGFFFEYEGTIYYYFDEHRENIGEILIALFKKRLHKEYWKGMQSWDYFNTHNAIAYRGGQGYSYSIFPIRVAS